MTPRHPAPGEQTVVHVAVQCDQRHVHEHERNVLGLRERRSIGEFDHGADPEEPAQPHRDVGGVRCLVRVEPEHLEKPRLYCAHRCLHKVQAPIPIPNPTLV